MRIAIFLDRVVTNGVLPFVLEETKWLKRMGYDTHLLLIKKDGNHRDFSHLNTMYLTDGFPSLLQHSFKLPPFHYFSSIHVISPLISPHIFRKKIDVLITHGPQTCLTAIQLWKRRKIPYIAFIHDPISFILPKCYAVGKVRYLLPFLLPLGLYLDNQIVNNAIVTVTQSSVHKEFLESISHSEVKVVHPGCYPYEEIPKERGGFILAGKAIWTWATRADLLLKIMAKLENNTQLVITGKWHPPYLEYFLQEAKRLGVDDRVSIRGFVSKEEMLKLYLGARVFVHTSVEAFGMTGLEAASHGCPFIMPSGSGVADLFTHSVHAFFPEEEDLDAYIEYTDRLMSDGHLAWKMGYGAWKRASAYSWKAHSRKIADIIETYVR